jgi:CrcB protein
MNLLFVGLGGALGAISRYLVVGFTTRIFGDSLPYGTLIVNSIGSFSLVFLLTLILHKLDPSSAIKLFVVVGFMGSFTTFSSFSFETIALFQDSLYIKAGMNILLNNILSIGFGVLGLYTARYFL